MSSKITFKEWGVNFFKGIWQALCWIGRVFNPKYKTKFWRVIWAVITLCVVIVTCIIGRLWYRAECRDNHEWVHKEKISHHIAFVKPHRSDKPGFIQNINTGEVITKGVDWVAVSSDEDSLIVYAKDNKRGYINRFSGEVAIPARYDKAWVFLSGVAGVVENDSVYFIDHFGQPINGMKFKFNPKNSGYVYHGDYCNITTDNGLMGLIDRNGNWAVKPEYDWIVAEVNNYWRMRKGNKADGLWYAFNDKAEQVTEMGYPDIEITEDLGIVATMPNHLQVAYGFDGAKSSIFLVKEYETMYYDTEKYDENCEKIYAPTTLRRYRTADGHEGLCMEDGAIVTEPLYGEISPVGKDLYLCKYKGSTSAALVNSNGETVKFQNQ